MIFGQRINVVNTDFWKYKDRKKEIEQRYRRQPTLYLDKGSKFTEIDARVSSPNATRIRSRATEGHEQIGYVLWNDNRKSNVKELNRSSFSQSAPGRPRLETAFCWRRCHWNTSSPCESSMFRQWLASSSLLLFSPEYSSFVSHWKIKMTSLPQY